MLDAEAEIKKDIAVIDTKVCMCCVCVRMFGVLCVCAYVWGLGSKAGPGAPGRREICDCVGEEKRGEWGGAV